MDSDIGVWSVFLWITEVKLFPEGVNGFVIFVFISQITSVIVSLSSRIVFMIIQTIRQF